MLGAGRAGWTGVGVQLLPFQVSASGTPTPPLFRYRPTATQLLAVAQETPDVQVLPFQVWISAPPPLTVSSAFSLMPTATQSFADGQDTP